MNRKQAASLLGIDEDSDATKSNHAFLAKLTELDERIQLAATEAMKKKYQGMRAELLAALQVMNQGADAVPQTTLSRQDLDDLPGAVPVGGCMNEPSFAPALKPPTTSSQMASSITFPMDLGTLMKHLPWMWISGGVTGLLVLGLILRAALLPLWEEIRPRSAEEYFELYTQASKLQGEIEQIRKRLEDHRGDLVQQLRSNPDSPRLNQIMILSRKRVYDNPEFGRLDGEFKAAERLISPDKESNHTAIAQLSPIRDRYQKLQTEIDRIPQELREAGARETSKTEASREHERIKNTFLFK